MTDNDLFNIRQQLKPGERIIPGKTLTVPTTPPFGDAPQPDAYGNDAERNAHLSNEVQRLEGVIHARGRIIENLRETVTDVERELAEARAEAKALRNAIEETREQLFLCLPEDQHDEWTRFFEPAHLPGMAVATLDSMTEGNAQVVEQVKADTAEARRDLGNITSRMSRVVQDVNMVREVITAAVDERGYMDDGLEAALQIVDNLLGKAIARATNEFTPPPADVNEVPF